MLTNSVVREVAIPPPEVVVEVPAPEVAVEVEKVFVAVVEASFDKKTCEYLAFENDFT